jgi:hypothetical protein
MSSVSSAVGRATAPERLGERRQAVTTGAEQITVWLLPVVAAIAPLAFLPGLGDTFELPKLAVLTVGLAVALVALAGARGFDLGTLRSGPTLAALAFLGLNVLATVFSIAPIAALVGDYEHDQGLLRLVVEMAYFFLAAAWIRKERDLARFAGGLALAAGACSALAVLQFAGFDPFRWSGYIEDARTAVGTIGHANSFAEFAVMSLPLTAWLSYRERLARAGPPGLLPHSRSSSVERCCCASGSAAAHR